jgi:hypothetical protein
MLAMNDLPEVESESDSRPSEALPPAVLNQGIPRLPLLLTAMLLMSALLTWATTLYNAGARQATTLDPRLIKTLESLDLTTIYGLNAADVARAQSILGQSHPHLMVMPYPGGDVPVTPILTRSSYLRRWLPPKHLEGFEVMTVAGGWYLLSHSGARLEHVVPHIASARVELRDRNGRVTACEPYRNGRFQCGPAGWMHVGPRTQQIDGADEACIWAHPIEGKTTVITYPPTRVELADGTRLHVDMGILDRSIGSGAGVDVRVIHGEREVTHRHPDRRGWTTVAIEPGDESHPLTIEVWAERVGRRHFCYRLSAR